MRGSAGFYPAEDPQFAIVVLWKTGSLATG